MAKRSILMSRRYAGWLTAAYLAKFLDLSDHGPLDITLLESPEIGIIGVGEGTFPTTAPRSSSSASTKAVHPAHLGDVQAGHSITDWVRTPSPPDRVIS